MKFKKNSFILCRCVIRQIQVSEPSMWAWTHWVQIMSTGQLHPDSFPFCCSFPSTAQPSDRQFGSPTAMWISKRIDQRMFVLTTPHRLTKWKQSPFLFQGPYSECAFPLAIDTTLLPSCAFTHKHMLPCVVVLWRTQSTSYPLLSLVTAWEDQLW